MVNRRVLAWVLAVTTVLVLRTAAAVSLKEATGALFAASDGKGQVQLLWFPPAGRWPAGGWRVVDTAGNVLAEQIMPGETEALAALSAKDAEDVRKLREVLAKAVQPADTQLIYGFLGARALSDWNYARALGLARAFKVPAGRRSYVVEGIDGGKPSGVKLTSQAVDSAVPTPLAPAPRDLRAEPASSGVALFWTPVPADRQLPVIAYQAERDGATVTDAPVVRGVRWDARSPALLDRNAPLETELTYRVFAVDLFGRRSAPATVKVFAADLKALEPPLDFAAKAGNGEVTLRWKRNANPHTTGYILERAFLNDGPYETITPRGLAANTEQYTDPGLRGGTVYHYRIRAMNTRGDLGVPSRIAVAQPAGAQPPGVAGLKAEVGRSRIHLTWQSLDVPLAGYFVERAAQGTEVWTRLHPRVRPETFYDDYFGQERGGGFSYRIVAVGFDNQESRPGNVVEVVLPDTTPPPAPRITGITGANGKVTLQFAPTGEGTAVRQFLVVRAAAPDDPGVVIGDPLSGDARSFEDDFVDAGQTLLYRMVAVDGNGNRSNPSEAVAVRVGAREIAPAAKPEVAFSREPFPHAVIRFAAAPDELGTVIQYRAGEGPWTVLAGPVTGSGEATQANVPAGTVRYRAVYQSPTGMQGKPSEETALVR